MYIKWEMLEGQKTQYKSKLEISRQMDFKKQGRKITPICSRGSTSPAKEKVLDTLFKPIKTSKKWEMESPICEGTLASSTHLVLRLLEETFH